ncbi:MAG: methionyl-tRNA formyltransferase [Puniceicoccales bacterium]|nr:methionyl-tRNA formyltransferase [Puniceicoccales bacterium]
MRRVVFFGSDGIGVGTLDWLAERSGEFFEIVGVVGGADRRSGRGMRSRSNPIVERARALGFPVLQPEDPRTDLLGPLVRFAADLCVVFAYGHILRREILDAVPGGFLNIHGSILPELRGPNPIGGAILAGKRETGISLMRMVRRMDAGPVYAVERVPVADGETAISLGEKLSAAAIVALDKRFKDILDGSLQPREQEEERATYTAMVRKEDGILHFDRPAAELEMQVRAHVGWPGSFFPLGKEMVRVGRVTAGAGNAENSPGKILGLCGGALEIATGDGILRCFELQRPFRKMLPAELVWLTLRP